MAGLPYDPMTPAIKDYKPVAANKDADLDARLRAAYKSNYGASGQAAPDKPAPKAEESKGGNSKLGDKIADWATGGNASKIKEALKDKKK